MEPLLWKRYRGVFVVFVVESLLWNICCVIFVVEPPLLNRCCGVFVVFVVEHVCLESLLWNLCC